MFLRRPLVMLSLRSIKAMTFWHGYLKLEDSPSVAKFGPGYPKCSKL